MHKFYFISLMLISSSYSVTLAPGLNLKHKGILSVCSYSQFKPVTFGNGEGFEADLLKSIANYWHVKIKFYPSDIYEGLWLTPSKPDSPCDVAIGGFSVTKARINEGAIFTHNTTTFNQSLLIRKEDYISKKITSYKSFKDSALTIGVVQGTVGEKDAYARAQEFGISTSIIKPFKSEAELLPALKSGQIDAIARGDIGNEYQASLDKNLITIDKRNFKEGFAISVNPHNPDLLLKLNIAITLVTHNGQKNFQGWLRNKSIFESKAISK